MKMSTFKFKYIFIALVLSIGSYFYIKVAYGIPYMCKADTRPIQYKRLSNGNDFPFLHDDHQVSSLKDNPYYNKYRSAVTRFPDIRSCLVSSERGKQVPNLTNFDWNQIKATEDAEVCMFRVFSSIGGIEGSKRWLRSQGFEIEIQNDYIKDGTTSVLGYISVKKCGELFLTDDFSDTPLGRLLNLDSPGYYAMWGDGYFGANGEVFGTQVSRASESL